MMLSKNTPTFQQVDNVITISFQQLWDQDDIAELKSTIFEGQDIRLIEHILGADRENFRLEWQHHIFCLNFDCYTQSCWIEAEQEIAQNLLPALLNLLKR